MGNKMIEDFPGSGNADRHMSRIRSILIEARGLALEVDRVSPSAYNDYLSNLDCLLADSLDVTDGIRSNIIDARIRRKQSNQTESTGKDY